jgi:hypothetical protein
MADPGGLKMAGTQADAAGLARPEPVRVLESAARLQEVVPDTVLVGGSFDHDHVLRTGGSRTG